MRGERSHGNSDTPLRLEAQRLLEPSRFLAGAARIVSLFHSKRATRKGLLLSVGGAITSHYWADRCTPRYFWYACVPFDTHTRQTAVLSGVIAVLVYPQWFHTVVFLLLALRQETRRNAIGLFKVLRNSSHTGGKKWKCTSSKGSKQERLPLGLKPRGLRGLKPVPLVTVHCPHWRSEELTRHGRVPKSNVQR